MITTEQKMCAHRDADYIFKELFPQCGMKERQGQTSLCHEMLDAMFGGKIMLSDAGTGIGKTYAYLTAAVIFHKYRMEAGEPWQPIAISTASIALQEAIHREYIPFLSKLLIRSGYLTHPMESVIRKGKSRYVCDERLIKRLNAVNLQKKNGKNAEALLSLRSCLDMDQAKHLSGYDRRQVAVPRICDCDRYCRYKRFLEDAVSGKYLFQICNHNFLLADAMNTSLNRHPILRPYCALIVDEAHKLPSAARQMFGRTLGHEDVLALCHGLKAEHYQLAAQNLLSAMRPILQGIDAETNEGMAAFERDRPRLLKDAWKKLDSIRRMIGDRISKQLKRELGRMISSIELFLDEEADIILYVDRDEYQRPLLCAAAGDMDTQMHNTLWSMPQPILLTSGTLAVGDDFSRFKAEAYIRPCPRLTESVSLSPFRYEKNCLLYVPHSAPVHNKTDLQPYYRLLAADIASLIRVCHGHALVLFNSYSAMTAVHGLLREADLPYPIFTMARDNPHIAEGFRQSGNGVLLATGPAWEGMDFPGDMVSLLIIPRLPFPIPDAFSDHLKEQYESLHEFIESVALPDMQIKLRQGFGRAIRLETDTCIVAVLDNRSLRDRRYHEAMREALPDMPMTGRLTSLHNFIHAAKDDGYFVEVRHG